MSDPLREQLATLLEWKEAHAGFDKAVDGLAPELQGQIPVGFEHSAWQLLEHIRLAQDDLLDFCRNAEYVHTMKWPDDYWPKSPEPPSAQAWAESLAGYKRGLVDFQQLVRSVDDLAAKVPTGKESQTYLRSILLVIDHTAYHVGQIVALRRALGIWN